MFIDKDSIMVNNISLGQYLTKAKYGYYKLYAPDSGRNLEGEQSGTLIGIFPKIMVTFRKLTQAEYELLVPILDSARQTLTYYDPNKKTNVTMDTYTGDYETESIGMISTGHKIEPFDISFISVRKRS